MSHATHVCPACSNQTATVDKKKRWSCRCGARGIVIKTNLANDYMAVLERPARPKEDGT